MTKSKDKHLDSVVPAPAHPQQRREPLPWQSPKVYADDPEASARVEAILASPSYRQADRDVDFLNTDETRGVRLEIDYLKPELLLQQHGMEHSIVVFGGTRLPEPEATRRKVNVLKQSLKTDPESVDLRRRLLVAQALEEKSRYYQDDESYAGAKS